MIDGRVALLAILATVIMSVSAEMPRITAGKNALRAAVTGSMEGRLSGEPGVVSSEQRGEVDDLSDGWESVRNSRLLDESGQEVWLPLAYVSRAGSVTRTAQPTESVRRPAEPDAAPGPEERDD